MPLASLWRRLLSLVYEVLLLTAILLAAGFVLLPLLSPAPALAGRQVFTILPLPDRILSFAYYVGIAALYFGWFWSNGRRTLAMKTWGLKLMTAHGDPLSPKQALARYFAAWIGPALAIVAYEVAGRWGLGIGVFNIAWALIDREHQFLHDRLIQTRLILVGNRPATIVSS